MKKISIVFLALIIVSGFVFQAEASAKGVWVSHCIHDGANVDAVFEILFEGEFAAGPNKRRIRWAFYDVDGAHTLDGEIAVGDNPDVHHFFWMEESGTGLAGVDGFICFWTEPDSGSVGFLTGSELYITGITLDAANHAAFDIYPRLFSPRDPSGSQEIVSFAWIDAAVYGAHTRLFYIAMSESDLDFEVVGPNGVPTFTTPDVSGRHPVIVYNTDNMQPFSPPHPHMMFTNNCLNIIDPATMGLPADFLSIMIKFTYTPPVGEPCSVFGHSVVSSGVLGVTWGKKMRTCAGE